MLHGHANFYEKRDFRVGKVKFFCKTVHTFPSYYTLWHCWVCVISTREIAWFVLLSSIPRAPFLSALSTQSGCWNVPSRKRGSLKLHWIPRFFSLSLSPPPQKLHERYSIYRNGLSISSIIHLWKPSSHSLSYFRSIIRESEIPTLKEEKKKRNHFLRFEDDHLPR